MRNVAMTALGILQRPPCADYFFDNHGPLEENDPPSQFLAKYKTRVVSAYDLNDGGERLVLPHLMPPPRFDTEILLPKW